MDPGRPDMALFKFTQSILEDKKIQIFNNGVMERDFTYISDLVKGIVLLINKALLKKFRTENIFDDSLSKAPFRIVNIGNSKPVKLLNLIELLEKI